MGDQIAKRVMVDMSATLIHHGHIRLLKYAANLGSVVIGLATDQEVLNTKGYLPELSYEERKEILLAIRYVDDVVPAPWIINDVFLEKHSVDVLVHGADNRNKVSLEKLRVLPRTEGISSSELRKRVLEVASICAVKELR